MHFIISACKNTLDEAKGVSQVPNINAAARHSAHGGETIAIVWLAMLSKEAARID